MIGASVHLYICLYVCDQQKKLNGILAVDAPFQILAVDFSSNLLTTLLLHVPQKLLFLSHFNVHLILLPVWWCNYGRNGKDHHNSHTFWFRVHFSEHEFSCLLFAVLLS